MALKKQVTLTQYGKGSHSDDSEGEQQEQNGAPTHRQQGDPEGPPANDAEHQMMVQAAASAFESNGDGDREGAANNDRSENYELSQEELVNLTQQFGDHSLVEQREQDTSVGGAKEGDHNDYDHDQSEDDFRHRNLTQDAYDSDPEVVDVGGTEVDSSTSGSSGGEAAALQRQGSIEPFLQPTPAKKRRVHRDTDREVRIEVRGDVGMIEKIYRLKEVFQSSSSRKGEIFVIEKFHHMGKTTKSAECRVLMRLKDTYIGPSEMDNDFIGIGKEPKYVQLYETKTIPLKLLDKRLTCIPPKESKTLIWHPNKKGNTGVGFKIAYSLPIRKKMRQSLHASGKSEITCLELFAGAGGMSQGLRAAGLTVKWAVENDANAATTWKMNHQGDDSIIFCEDLDVFYGKIKEGKESPYDEINSDSVNHIHGSPPCTGFSRANRAANGDGGKKDEKDRKLTNLYFEILLDLMPDTITMENVDNILSPKYEKYLKDGISKLIEAGYQCVLLNVSSASFGDPQERKRCILICVKNTLPFDPDLLKVTHGNTDGLLGFVTPKNVLGDLEDAKPGGVLRSATDSHLIYDHVKKGTELPDDENEIVKLEPDKPAKTLTKSNHLQHYKHKDRGLTIRELARLQSFPDSYWFSGDVKCQRDQIGNAVPCKLAEAVGLFVLRSYLWPYETKADAEMFGKSLEEAWGSTGEQ